MYNVSCNSSTYYFMKLLINNLLSILHNIININL